MKGKTALSFPYCLSILSLSTTLAYAGSMGDDSLDRNLWTLGGSALIMQPSPVEQFNYAIVKSTNASTYETNNQIVNPSYSWAFDVFFRYDFIPSERDLTLSYMRFTSSDNGKVSLPLAPNYIYTQFFRTAEGFLYNNVDAVDLVVGQNLRLNNAVRVHGIAGVGYAHINREQQAVYDRDLGFIPNEAKASYTIENSTFNGAGPKLGMDVEYMFNNSPVSLIGGLSVALLVGSQNIDGQQVTTMNDINSFTATNTINTTVTNVNANLGLRYYFNAPVTAELGYRVYQYINYLSLAGGYLTLSTSWG